MKLYRVIFLQIVCSFLLSTIFQFGLLSQVKSFKDIMNFDFGERITLHYQMANYLKYLDESSTRVAVVNQGKSWEGKELLLAIVTSPENHARLNEIQLNAQRLGDPRALSDAEASRIIENQPAIVWLGGSIHGYELSGAEGLLKLLQHLTTNDDPEVLSILQNTVILVDPILNPDGRDAHAYYNHRRVGRTPNPSRDDWVNDNNFWEALKFRTGHYFFDTNRDWFAHTQRETQARVPILQAWRPQVGVDAHEMGPDVEFYFDPPTDPVSPFFPEYALKWFEVFGKAHADAFDAAGYEYTLREMFNYFYPAYTTSYLSYQGAVGMLYEQGSSRGLALERSDGTVRTLADALEQQYVAFYALVKSVAKNRDELLRDYYESHVKAIEDGRRDIRRYIITLDGDPFLITELVNLLMRNGIEVSRLGEQVTFNNVRDRTGASLGRSTFPAGSYVVDAAQPRKQLIRALLEPDIPMPDEFLREARERIDRGESPRFYDITAYSLPLLFNVNTFSTTDGRTVTTQLLENPLEVNPHIPNRNARYAYLVDGKQSRAITFLYHVRNRGYRAQMMTEPTKIEGREFDRGTVVVRVGGNGDGVHDTVRELGLKYSVDVYAVDTGMPAHGFTAPGSPTTIDFRKPEIAIIAEMPVFGYSFGWAWYTLDQQYKIPVTVLRASFLRTNRLDRYDVLILPNLSGAALRRELGEEGIERMKQWVRDGGMLVTIGGGATDFVREQLELISLRSWYDTDEGKNKQRFSVPGSIFRGILDMNQWLTSGIAEEFSVLVNSDRLYLPPDEPPSTGKRIVGYFPNEGKILLSGHGWEESLERMHGTVFAYEERVGRGRVITFSEDMNFRAYFRGANRLFLNAVVVGPSAP